MRLHTDILAILSVGTFIWFVCLFVYIIHRPVHLSREHAEASSRCGYLPLPPQFSGLTTYLGEFMSIYLHSSKLRTPKDPQIRASLRSSIVHGCDCILIEQLVWEVKNDELVELFACHPYWASSGVHRSR